MKSKKEVFMKNLTADQLGGLALVELLLVLLIGMLMQFFLNKLWYFL